MKPFLSTAPQASGPLLICLDLQRDQAAEASDEDFEAAARCIATCQRVLRHARAAGWRIAHVHRRCGRFAALPEGQRPIEGLEPRASEPVFYREGPSAFSSCAFREFLATQEDARPIVIGFSLQASVLFTAVSSFELGEPITVVEGALAAAPVPRCSGEVVESVLLGVLANFAEVVSTDQLLESTSAGFVQAANLP